MYDNSRRVPGVISFSSHQHFQTRYQVYQTAAAGHGRGGRAWYLDDLVTFVLKPRLPTHPAAVLAAAAVVAGAVAPVTLPHLPGPSAE